MKRGQTIVELIVVVAVIAIIVAVIFEFGSKHIVGNKQIIDFNRQKFEVAYVLGDDHKWEKIKIKAWQDWENSDSIQIVREDGSYLYTHLRNVKLESR